MTDLLGISTDWERRIRATKRGIFRALGYSPVFTGVYVSEDIAQEIQATTGVIGSVGDDTTFELIPLRVDHELPIKSVVYIWEDKHV
jgi:hypothetical protein